MGVITLGKSYLDLLQELYRGKRFTHPNFSGAIVEIYYRPYNSTIHVVWEVYDIFTGSKRYNNNPWKEFISRFDNYEVNWLN